VAADGVLQRGVAGEQVDVLVGRRLVGDLFAITRGGHGDLPFFRDGTTLATRRFVMWKQGSRALPGPRTPPIDAALMDIAKYPWAFARGGNSGAARAVRASKVARPENIMATVTRDGGEPADRPQTCGGGWLMSWRQAP